MRVVFFGTPRFAAQILEDFLNQGVEVAAVVTQPARPKRRSTDPSWEAVGALALEREIPILAPQRASNSEFLKELQAFQADVFIVVAYGQILRSEVLDMPPLGCFNAHASLLPLYRGAAPIQRALMDGVSETGITIIAMNPEMDAGDMVRMARISVSPSATFGEIQEQLCVLSQQELLALLEDLDSGQVDRHPQSHERATFAPKILPQDTQIQWDRLAEDIHNQIRALSPKPGAWCPITLRGNPKRLKVLRSCIARDGVQGGLVVQCQEGAVELLEVQVEGKRVVSGAEFLRGVPQGEFRLESRSACN